MMRMIVLLILLGGTRCSSPAYMLPDTDTESRADGEAFTGSGMHFRKAMPDRREWRPWEFYYKHCALNGESTPFARTVYECTGPY